MLDRDLLPRDEIDQRLARFRGLLEAEHLEAAVVVGTVESFAPLTYLTAYAPMHQWATAIVHRVEPTVLLAGLGGARNLPYVSSLTWVSDLRYYPSVGEGAVAVLGEWGVGDGVGVVGAGELPMQVSRALRADLAAFDTTALDGAFARLRRAKRPRELAALRLAAGLRDRALEAGRRVAADAGEATAIGLAVERAARLGGARDVRVLIHDPDHDTWETPGADGARRGEGACTVYLAVERCGYWAEALERIEARAGDPPPRHAAEVAAETVVAVMAAAARPGAPLAAVAEAGLAALDRADGLEEAARQSARAIGLGAAIGLGRERPVTAASAERVEAGEVLALRCGIPFGTHLAASSRDVVVTAGGARPLVEVTPA